MIDHLNEVKRLVNLEKLEVHEDRGWVQRNCYKIRQRFEGQLHKSYGLLTDVDGYHLLELQFIFQNQTELNVSKTAVVYLTSEENAYGAVGKTWHDGLVRPMELKIGYFHNFTITETTQYKLIPGACLPDPSFPFSLPALPRPSPPSPLRPALGVPGATPRPPLLTPAPARPRPFPEGPPLTGA